MGSYVNRGFWDSLVRLILPQTSVKSRAVSELWYFPCATPMAESAQSQTTTLVEPMVPSLSTPMRERNCRRVLGLVNLVGRQRDQKIVALLRTRIHLERSCCLSYYLLRLVKSSLFSLETRSFVSPLPSLSKEGAGAGPRNRDFGLHSPATPI